MSTSRQPLNVNLVEFRPSLWIKLLECGLGYDESMVNCTLLEGLHGSIRHSTNAYCGSHKTAQFQELARYTTLLRSLQSESVSLATILYTVQLQGLPDRRSGCSTRNVMVTDASVTNTRNKLPLNSDRVMANNKGNTATPSSTTPTLTTSTTQSLDTGGRCRSRLRAYHCVTTCLILLTDVRRKLVHERLEAIKKMLPRRSF